MAPLLAWRFYSRFRRSIGRQKLQPKRQIVSVAIMTLVQGVITFAVIHAGAAWWPLLAGLAVGSGIGAIGCRLTRYEIIDGEQFYTLSAWLGIAVSMLLVARVAYRFVQLYSSGALFPATTPDLGHSPLTLFILGLTFGYYLTTPVVIFFSLKNEPPPAAP